MPRRGRADGHSGKAPARHALDGRVTADIRAAFFEELAEVGYGRLSVDSIVRRAGASKAAIYRRWPSKDAMALALVADVAVHGVDVPDTGALRSDLRRFLAVTQDAMRHPLARRIIPAIAAESQRNPRVLVRGVDLDAGAIERLVVGLLAAMSAMRMTVRMRSTRADHGPDA